MVCQNKALFLCSKSHDYFQLIRMLYFRVVQNARIKFVYNFGSCWKHNNSACNIFNKFVTVNFVCLSFELNKNVMIVATRRTQFSKKVLFDKNRGVKKTSTIFVICIKKYFLVKAICTSLIITFVHGFSYLYKYIKLNSSKSAQYWLDKCQFI